MNQEEIVIQSAVALAGPVVAILISGRIMAHASHRLRNRRRLNRGSAGLPHDLMFAFPWRDLHLATLQSIDLRSAMDSSAHIPPTIIPVTKTGHPNVQTP